MVVSSLAHSIQVDKFIGSHQHPRVRCPLFVLGSRIGFQETTAYFTFSGQRFTLKQLPKHLIDAFGHRVPFANPGRVKARLFVEKRVIKKLQRLGGNRGHLPGRRAGIRISTIEQGQVGMPSLPLNH